MYKGLTSGSFSAFLPIRRQGWPLRSHWLLAGLCAAVFALLMPREEAFPYKFQQGQPWSYRSLNAPFDFEVLYPEEQVRGELDRVNAEHAPYFKLDPEVSRQQKKRFARMVEDQIQISRHDTQFEDLVQNQAAYIAFGQQLLDIIYGKGLADPTEEVFKDTPGYIYLVSGNMERRVPVQEVGTVNNARNFLTDTLPFSSLRQPELILPLLEKSLAVNVQYSDSLTVTHKRRKLAAVTGTGILVHKGEQIIQPGEIVNSDLEQKLVSLKNLYHTDREPYSAFGIGILSLLAFMSLLWAINRDMPGDRQVFLFVAITALLLSIGIGWLGRVGEAAPLLLPLWALPLLLRLRIGNASTGRLIWLAVIYLTTVATNWPGGWLAIQGTGLLSTLFFLENQTDWKSKLLATAAVWAIQLIALTGLGLAGQLPGAMRWTDGAIFLFLGMLLSFMVYPLRRLVKQQIGNTVEWDSD